MDAVKTIALVAHDNRKKQLIEWVTWNHAILLQHRLVCTGTKGRLVEEVLLTFPVVYNVPIACNRSTADFLISSPLMTLEYAPRVDDYTRYAERALPADPGKGSGQGTS